MKSQLSCLVILFLVSVSFAQQEYNCISGTVCDPARLASIADKARTDLIDAVRIRLNELIVRLNGTQTRISNAITSDDFRDNLREELSGDIEEFRAASDEFFSNLVQHLIRDTASIRANIAEYARGISFNHFEMIVARIQNSERFQAIITSIREAKECFLDNLYERGFMNTTTAVSAVIDRSRNTIDRIGELTRTALADLAPVRNKIGEILSNFRPIPSCLQIFSTSLGCRLCQFADNEITLSTSPCFGFCDQTVIYCLSVVRGALPDVRDVIRVVKLISEALEGGNIQERFSDTLLSFSALATAVKDLGESVVGFLQDFDIVEFIRDVANECFPGITETIKDLFDTFREAVRIAVDAIRATIQAAIDRIQEGLNNSLDYLRGLFSRRRRLLTMDELPSLDDILQLAVDDFCDNLPSNRMDPCWNGTAIAPYEPDTLADFTVASQVNNPVVKTFAEFNPEEAVRNAEAEVSALSSTTSSTDVCESLSISDGNVTLYNQLSNSEEACFSELNGSGATLLASSIFLLLTILVVHSLYLF